MYKKKFPQTARYLLLLSLLLRLIVPPTQLSATTHYFKVIKTIDVKESNSDITVLFIEAQDSEQPAVQYLGFISKAHWQAKAAQENYPLQAYKIDEVGHSYTFKEQQGFQQAEAIKTSRIVNVCSGAKNIHVDHTTMLSTNIAFDPTQQIALQKLYPDCKDNDDEVTLSPVEDVAQQLTTTCFSILPQVTTPNFISAKLINPMLSKTYKEYNLSFSAQIGIIGLFFCGSWYLLYKWAFRKN